MATDVDAIGWGELPAMRVVDGKETFALGPQDDYVNVMGDVMPRMPNFPVVKAKAGTVRGVVGDLHGRPLQGAYIAIRSTATGGLYSGASDEMDANGFYEITVLWGQLIFMQPGTSLSMAMEKPW